MDQHDASMKRVISKDAAGNARTAYENLARLTYFLDAGHRRDYPNHTRSMHAMTSSVP